jgi:uncharacterized membrane protein
MLGSVPAWLYGLAYYAKAKGRAAGWAILGLFGFIGLIVLALLPDRYRPRHSKTPWTRKVIIGLLLFMVAFYALATFMASRTAPPAAPAHEQQLSQGGSHAASAL